AIEHDFLYTCLDGTFRNQLADSSSCCGVSTSLERALQICFERRSCSKRVAVGIVDDLSVDVLGRTVHGQTRTTVGNLLALTTNARGALLARFLGSHDM